MKYQILRMDRISKAGLDVFPEEHYQIVDEAEAPDAILVRSSRLPAAQLPASIKAIARAGAGFNNIPVEHCTGRGIPVFNTPGCNANAVKELVMASLLLACRDVLGGVSYVESLAGEGDPVALSRQVEKGKGRFRGHELAGKTLGVVGLGSIGSLVAKAALGMEMRVLGFDPMLSVEAALRLPTEVRRMESLEEMAAQADYLSLHLPLLPDSRELIGPSLVPHLRKGACLINLARGEIVNMDTVIECLDKGILSTYVSDFPHPRLLGRKDVILMPHIGAGTHEAQDNCAVMAARQLRDFLEIGGIANAVNFPTLTSLPEKGDSHRLAVSNRNAPGMLGQITTLLAEAGINVVDLVNRSRGDIAYSIIDVESAVPKPVLERLQAIDGVVNLRLL